MKAAQMLKHEIYFLISVTVSPPYINLAPQADAADEEYTLHSVRTLYIYLKRIKRV